VVAVPDDRRRRARHTAPTDPVRPAAVADNRRRQERAYQLRMAALSYQEIADSPDKARRTIDPVTGEEHVPPLYSGPGAAYAAVQKALDRRSGMETTEAMRALTNARYEAAIRILWPKVLQGDNWTVDRLAVLMRDQRALLGLDMPKRREARVEVITTDLVDQAIQQLEEDLARRGELATRLETEEEEELAP
jgi:hypothetical protein